MGRLRTFSLPLMFSLTSEMILLLTLDPPGRE